MLERWRKLPVGEIGARGGRESGRKGWAVRPGDAVTDIVKVRYD
jgi:hypothetical protein